MKATLVIMAAGMASRFGGMKQIEPVGLNGEVIADYSVYDAKRAGFDKIIFIIKKEHEMIFNEMIVNNMRKHIDVECVFQEMTDLPRDYKNKTPSVQRIRPWGTGQAVLACRNTIKDHFAVINADDFYGTATFEKIISHFKNEANEITTANYCNVGFELENTISDHGSANRAVLNINSDGYLSYIEEVSKVARYDGKIKYEKQNGSLEQLPENTPVSMNAWGFTPMIFNDINEYFREFLDGNFNNDTAEFLLPEIIGKLINNKKATVKVYKTQEKWYGVTYKNDAPIARVGIKKLITEGKYPEKLWN